MSNSIVSLLIFSTMLVSSFANPNAVRPLLKDSDKEKLLIAVQGMVYCQSCAYTGSWSLTGARPLASARVGVSCRDHKNRVRFYKAVSGDKNGYFYCPLEGPSNLPACTVKLLSSPNKECNLLTNINGGIEGSLIRDANKTVVGKGYKGVVYSAGPLAFRPAHCPPLLRY